MSTRVYFTGLEEFKADLRKLPTELVDDALYIMRHRVVEAMLEIHDSYPEYTGNLKKGLQITEESSRFGVSIVLANKAKHAFIFENGTEVRKTAEGWIRGKMPPGKVFVKIAPKHRRIMYRELADMMRAKGLRVTGIAA